MPRPSLLQRLQRRPNAGGRPVRTPWNEVLARILADLLRCRHGARTRPGLSATAHAALDLGDDAALRGLCDELARGVSRLDARLVRVAASVLGRDDAGVVRLVVRALAPPDEPVSCVVRLSPRLPPEIHRPS